MKPTHIHLTSMSRSFRMLTVLAYTDIYVPGVTLHTHTYARICINQQTHTRTQVVSGTGKFVLL